MLTYIPDEKLKPLLEDVLRFAEQEGYENPESDRDEMYRICMFLKQNINDLDKLKTPCVHLKRSSKTES
jgi:hypothetical protein